MLPVVPDPLHAIASWLRSKDLAGGRVFEKHLPRAAEGGMPQATVVIRRAGLPQQTQGWSNERYVRFDFVCYGKPDMPGEVVSSEATLIEGQLFGLFRDLERPVVSEGCTLYSVIQSGGPTDQVDGDTQWPFTLVSYDVYLNSAPQV